MFYALFYFVGLVFVSGLFLSIYNLEIFTAFLWMTEVIVILIILFLIFNLNPSGNIKNTNSSKETTKDNFTLTSSVTVSFLSTPYIFSELTLPEFTNDIYL